MSVLQKFFSHPAPAAPVSPATTFAGETKAAAGTSVETPDDLLDYVDDGDPMWHDPGEPPHWAPECGTPAYSTRHYSGA